MNKFTFISDPAHGWIKVPTKLILDLNIAGEISPYSYVHGKFSYLEEDCDMNTFIKVLEEREIEYKIENKYQKNTRIRSYHPFSIENAVAWLNYEHSKDLRRKEIKGMIG